MASPKPFHREEYVVLSAVTHKSVLVSWGAFFFRVSKDTPHGGKLIDDDDLDHVEAGRRSTIGARSDKHGIGRVVVRKAGTSEVVGERETTNSNHCWVPDLAPDTEYEYDVFVNGSEWAAGPLFDWNAAAKALQPAGERYRNRFKTFPHPGTSSAVTFAVIGDFGTGVRKPDSDKRCQASVARALREVVDSRGVRLLLTTGDNIYARNIFGSGSGDEDDDWFFTYYQPYRYIINRIPVYPCVGNHDTGESEDSDDFDQLVDNFYIDERMRGEEQEGRALMDPGLFYKFRVGADVEFICIDSSHRGRLLKLQNPSAFLDSAFAPAAAGSPSPTWRIPFAHHPLYSAGPRHKNEERMIAALESRFAAAGVRVMFSGHEHNFQCSVRNGTHFFVTGGAGKLRTDSPGSGDLVRAFTHAWAAKGHFLLVEARGDRLLVTAFAAPASGPATVLQVNQVPPHSITFPVEILP